MLNFSRSAARSSHGSIVTPGAVSDIEKLPYGARWIPEHVQAHLQQRRRGGVELRDVEPLLDRRPHESCRAEAHAAFELATRLILPEVARLRVRLPEGFEHRAHRVEGLCGH